MMRYLPVLTVVLALVAPLGVPAGARAQVEILGRVIDDATLEPIAGVEVRIYDVRLEWRVEDRAFTDENGRFRFEVDDTDGGYFFNARRLGYETTETPVLWIEEYRTYQVEIRLDADAVLLAPIEVVARSPHRESPVVVNFFNRLDQGLGHYFTYEDIERIKPQRVTDILARVPGVRLSSSGAGHQRVVYFSRGTRQCPAHVFIDGMLWSRPEHGDAALAVDDAVAPGSVLGIEVYRGTSTIPAEFLTPQSQCGVVAIWTRRR